MAITSAFQADEAGSIPVTRSRFIAAKNIVLGRFFVWGKGMFAFHRTCTLEFGSKIPSQILHS